jgi:OPA family glycerol-3-phosphate transporter-like MFS transporter
MPAIIVLLGLAAIVALYFRNNPHSRWFMVRRFSMTYAFMYMARYNLNVAKTRWAMP